MEIQLNGETTEIPEDLNLTTLIANLGLSAKRIAVEVNLEIIPRGQHPQYRLQPGDKVEVVVAIGGGDGDFTL